MTRVGYWNNVAEAGPLDGTPVIVASPDQAAALEAALGDRYASEFYGLRPGVLLAVETSRAASRPCRIRHPRDGPARTNCGVAAA
jgi:hypothetical protein